MTLNGVIALILRYFTFLSFISSLSYFTELVYNVAVKQLSRFVNLLLIVYGHIKTICAIIQRLFGQNKLITRFDGPRCIDD